jgi:hypothetical protein
LDSFNKFSKVLIDKLPNVLPPYRKVDHMIEMVLGSILPSKAPNKFKQKELERLKK